MFKQLIFVVEADEKSKSDYIYIRSLLELCYNYRLRTDIKVSIVYMGGKGNYNKKSVCNKIANFRKMYSLGKSYVIYCFDTDKYDSNPDELKTFNDKCSYCKDMNYDFVWFCHDIEEVFLGKSVLKHEKTDKAKDYSKKCLVNKVDLKMLKTETISKKHSNLLLFLDKYYKDEE